MDEHERLMTSFALQAAEEEYLSIKAIDGREAHQHSVNAARLLREAGKHRLALEEAKAAA